MAAKVLVLYNQPSDPDAFDARYRGTHTALALKIPGLRGFHVSMGQVMTPDRPSAYHQIVELTFNSMEDLQAGMGSAEGQAAVADALEIATGGVAVHMFESHPVA